MRKEDLILNGKTSPHSSKEEFTEKEAALMAIGEENKETDVLKNESSEDKETLERDNIEQDKISSQIPNTSLDNNMLASNTIENASENYKARTSFFEKVNHLILTDDDKKDDYTRKTTNILIAIAVLVFTLLLFSIAYAISWWDASEIKELQEARSKAILEMINVNTNTYRANHLISKNAIKNYINNSSQQTNNKEDTEFDKQAFLNYIDTFNNSRTKNIKLMLEKDANFNIVAYLENEVNNSKSELNTLMAEKMSLVEKLKKLQSDSIMKSKSTWINSLADKLEDSLRFEVNIEKLTKNKPVILSLDTAHNLVFVSPERKNNFIYTDIETSTEYDKLKNIIDVLNPEQKKDAASPMDKWEISNPSDSKGKYILISKHITLADIFVQKLPDTLIKDPLFSTQYQALNDYYKKVLVETAIYKKQIDSLSLLLLDKDKLIETKKATQLSLEQYKKNKTYMFEKQFEINDGMIKFAINKGVGYLAFYNALIIVILTFSAILTICIFSLSNKGWGNANVQLRVLTVMVLVILGVSNLVLVTLKPKENYMAYIKSADKNENIQIDILNFFNDYDKLNEVQIDSMLRYNLQQMTRFIDIVPQKDDSKLIQEIDRMNPTNVK